MLIIDSSWALPPTDPTGDPPGTDRALTCIENAAKSLTVTPPSITLGATARLAWSVVMPAGCGTASNMRLAGMTVGASGTMNVQPMASATYTLTMAIPHGTATVATTNLGVTLPPTVNINGSTPAWRALLIQAVGTPNAKVNLAANVDMDMTGMANIVIAEGVTLTSESALVNAPPLIFARVAAAPVAALRVIDGGVFSLTTPNRDASHLGPRLYTRTNSKRGHLFEIAGRNVHVRNFRLQGPQYDVATGDDKLERGIYINYAPGIAITNMEFSGWGGTGIYVIGDAHDHRTRPYENVWIHDNFFHNNQHEGGDGYGVEVKVNAHALIERNAFDFNRHAISSDGATGTGYIARYNLILKGGGFHECYGLGIDVYCHYTQQFDVHGLHECARIWEPIFGWHDIYPYGCGQAGEEFEMSNNAFQYTRGDAIKVRGNPTTGARVIQNVFAHSSSGDAISQNGSSGLFGDNISNPIQQSGNKFGVKTAGKYGVCDFDGDGKDDLFLATGASRWYMSGANMHWVFLNTSTERIEQLGLGDFDGDHRCDVFSVHANDFGIYKSGSGAWQSLGTYGIPMSQLRFGDFNGDGITDIFRRDSSGQWWIVSPGHYGWTAIQSSSIALSQLRFGDFNGDRVTDVIAVENGHWSISWSGREGWQPLNTGTSASLASVQIADLNGDGIDDIARFSRSSAVAGKWEVSWNGRSGWQTLAGLSWPAAMSPTLPSSSVLGYVGRFSGAAHKDLISMDFTRVGQILDQGGKRFVPYARYLY